MVVRLIFLTLVSLQLPYSAQAAKVGDYAILQVQNFRTSVSSSYHYEVVEHIEKKSFFKIRITTINADGTLGMVRREYRVKEVELQANEREVQLIYQHCEQYGSYQDLVVWRQTS